MAPRKDSRPTPKGRETVYHTKQVVNKTDEGIFFKYYEIVNGKKVSYIGKKNKEGKYFIKEKIGDKEQAFEDMTQEQFIKKIGTYPHLRYVIDYLNQKKTTLARARKTRKASKRRSTKSRKLRRSLRKKSRKSKKSKRRSSKGRKLRRSIKKSKRSKRSRRSRRSGRK